MDYLKLVTQYGSTSTSEVTYSDGKLVLERVESPDLNGDTLPDYSSTRTLTYNDSGLLAVDETKFYFDGVQSTTDYRKVENTYTADGKVDVTLTDDWAFLDYIIGRDCDYDEQGRLVVVKEMDPFDWGDEAYHQTGSVFYDDAAKKITYAGSAVWDSGQEDAYGFSNVAVQTISKTARYSKELVTSNDPTGAIIFRMQEEKWYNSNGQLTTILESVDGNLDGKFNPGGLSNHQDYRTKEVMKYDADGVMVFHTVDEGLNGIEYTMTLTPVDMLVS